MSQNYLEKTKRREESTVDKLKRSLNSFGKSQSWPVFIDKIPASQRFGRKGRADLYVDLGPYHLRIEVKDTKGKESDQQEQWRLRHLRDHNPHQHHLVVGKEGVDQFMQDLNQTLHYYGHWFDLQRADAIS